MNAQAAFDRLKQGALMAGMRGHFPPDVALAHAHTLVDAGQIDVFEFTMNSTQPLEAMEATKRAFGDNAAVGMGTVLDVEMAQRVIDAGGDIIIAPSFNPDVVSLAQKHDVLVIPGVLTPTECVNAWALGTKILKIFPIGSMGLDYFKAVRGPLDHIQFLCNGGMTDQNLADFLKAGAVGCGMAGWLTGNGTMPLDQVAKRAQSIRQIVTSVRSGQPVLKTV